MKIRSIGVAIVIIIFLGLGAWMVYSRTAPQTHKENINGDTIEMTKDGFTPDTIAVAKGTTVRFVNVDAVAHWPASDLHPSHTIYPEFDPKEPIQSGKEWAFTFDKVGEWSMHDHLAPYFVGTITVR